MANIIASQVIILLTNFFTPKPALLDLKIEKPLSLISPFVIPFIWKDHPFFEMALWSLMTDAKNWDWEKGVNWFLPIIIHICKKHNVQCTIRKYIQNICSSVAFLYIITTGAMSCTPRFWGWGKIMIGWRWFFITKRRWEYDENDHNGCFLVTAKRWLKLL